MITKEGARKALSAIQNRKPVEIKLDPNFIPQNRFINETARYLAAQCSRRSGKTNGLAIRIFRTMERHPGSQSLYLTLTQDSARGIIWPVLKELNELHSLGYTFTDSTLVMKHATNGSELKCLGADMKNFIKRLKGRKYACVCIDEAQDFGTHLQSLIDDVLVPSIADYADGWLALTGTPGPVPQGVFFDITEKGEQGFVTHKWTLLDNPYMPRVEEFLSDLIAKRKWESNNPTLLREYRNKWVLDVESLWIRYKEHLNDYAELPKGKWNYILGVDIGFKDADALAVVGWRDGSPDTYLIEEIITPRQGITELANQIEATLKKYPISKIVMDEGGLGKKAAEEMRRRHALPIHAAEKSRKQETVEFFNDHLRLGKFKAKKDSRFAQDSYLVQIDWDKTTPDRIVIKKKPHSDIIDAVLYAFKESPAYTNKLEKPKPVKGTEEFKAAQREEMMEEAIERHNAEIQEKRWLNGYED